MGYKVILITQEIEPEKEFDIDDSVIRCLLPKRYAEGRGKVLQDIIQKNDVDLVLYHAGSSSLMLFDLILTKVIGAQFWIMRHELSVQDMGILARTLTGILNSYRLADRVIVLSRMEECFYRLMNCKATYIPNPVQFSPEKIDYSKNDGSILWLGRLELRQKNYRDALEIMKKLVKERPKAKMVILGSEQTKGSEDYIKNFIKNNALEENIEWHPYTLDIQSFYRKSKIHLVTSSYESFSMMMIESKSFGLPLVTYDLPYLEVLKDKKGYISVPQSDLDAAVDALKMLLDDEDLCQRLSNEALKSVEFFRKYDLKAKWISMLDSSEESVKNDINIDDCRLFIQTLFQHYDKGVLTHRNAIDAIREFSIFKYLKYKILSKIAFGRRKNYKEKYNNQKEMYILMRKI